MIASLRRRHLRMWLIIAPVILMASTWAYLIAPEFPVDSFHEATISFPELKRSVVSENYMFNLKKNYSGGNVLEVMQISKINPVSELAKIEYEKPGSKKTLTQELGMMGGNKSYFFNLGSIEPPFRVMVIDTIKKQTLADISF